MLATTPAYWRALLPNIPLWHALTLPQRQAALVLSHAWQPLPHAFRNLTANLAELLFETDPQGRKRPAEALRGLIALNVQLAEWTSPKGGVDIPRYVQSVSTHAQRHAMTGVRIGSHPAIAAGAFAKRMTSGAFSRALAESKAPQDFLRAVGGWVPDGAHFGPVHHKALQAWLAKSGRKGNTTFILDRDGFAPEDKSCRPEEILHLAIGFGLVILQRLPDTLLPTYGVIAPGQPADQKPANIERKPAPETEPFARPFLLDDMAVWLRALKAEPAAVLGDGWSVPLAQQRRVAKGFPALPDYLPGEGFDRDARSAAALWMIYRLDLARAEGAKAKDLRLALTAAGEAWLAQARREKLATALAWIPIGARSQAKPKDRLAFLGPFSSDPFPQAAATETVTAWLDAAFASLRAPSAWKPFLASAAEKANPFLAEAEKDAELAGRWTGWSWAPEDAYRALILHHAARLASLGALAFAPGPKGSLSVTLAPIGAWLYRKSETWDLPAGDRPVAVVGADFTVTLVVPDPDAQIELALFCEPAGAAFRITRKSIQAAAHDGHTAATLLKTLQAFSRHVLPANVTHEIKAWAGTKKTIRLSETILIEGEDPIVLAEIRSAFPKEFASAGESALKYLGKGSARMLAQRLRKRGFFLD